jgi:hypothetical protein
MIDSHKRKGLVDYAHKHFFDLNDQPVNPKKKDLLLRKGFVDSILFRRPIKYKKEKFRRREIVDEAIRQGVDCDLIQLGPRRVLFYI